MPSEQSHNIQVTDPETATRPALGGSGILARQDWRSYQLFRRFLLALLFAFVLFACRWLAYQLRFEFEVWPDYAPQLPRDWPWVIGLQLLCLIGFGQLSGIYRYVSLPDIIYLAWAMALSGALLHLTWFVLPVPYCPPRGVVMIQTMLGFLALGGMRAGWRLCHERYYSGKKNVRGEDKIIAIIGAGDAGASLVRDLTAHPHLGLLPVAFLDDDPQKWNSRIHGIRVVGPPESLRRLKKRLGIQEVVIALPSASSKRLGEIVDLLQKEHLRYVTVPGIDQLTSGKVSISQLRPVNIEDLLGREPVDLRANEITEVLKGRVVMVTGAGGSIGSELCRQIATFSPEQLLLVEQSEVQLFQIEQELRQAGYAGFIQPIIADVLDEARMRVVLQMYRARVIFHAAAHKHVTMMEIQPGEAIKNNSVATALLVELAQEYQVERFVMISTDKAVNPTSVMGASKRLAEVFLQAYAQANPGGTKFVAVRFGNVLGSSGSVVPIFERQIAAGGPITVTDPEVVRFFMTIPEAVGLVLQSCAQAQGGEIYVLDMGKPVKIVDLARQMVRLSGLEPDKDIEIKFIGLRPGEKLFEEMKHSYANCADTAHSRIKRLTNAPSSLDLVRSHFNELKSRLHIASGDELKRMLKAILPEYIPYVPVGCKERVLSHRPEPAEAKAAVLHA